MRQRNFKTLFNKNLKKSLIGIFVILIFALHSFGKSEGKIKIIENKGQWDAEIKSLAAIPGGYIYFLEDGWTYSFLQKGEHHHEQNHRSEAKKGKGHAVKVQLIGSQISSAISGFEEYNFKHNYYKGNDPSKWASGANIYRGFKYENIYSNIDLTFKESEDKLKYEFEVRPGADPSEIVIEYKGADRVNLHHGDLVLSTSINTVVEEKPYCFQIINGVKKEVKAKFKLENNELRFEFPEGYDTSYTLIIDPVLTFSTFSGSVSDNWGFSATYDNEGNAYGAGIVFDPGIGYPTTEGAFDVDFSGAIDVGIMKFNSTGEELLYSSFLGGTLTDVPTSLIVNNNNELVVLGVTSSQNFSVTNNAYQAEHNGGNDNEPIGNIRFVLGSDLFISVLSEDGSRLVGSSYFGGSGDDGVNLPVDPSDVTSNKILDRNYGDELRGDLAIDNQNNIYITTCTTSPDLETNGSFQPNLGGRQDGVIAKFNSSVSNLVWASYLGGRNADGIYSIKLNQNNDIVVAGGSISPDFPTTNGAFQGASEGNVDGVISVISNDGRSLLNSTFVGTRDYDQIYFADIDPDGNIAVLGQSTGGMPITEGVYSNPNSGIFIQLFSSNLSERLVSTTIGSGQSSPKISPTAFMLNECGNIYLSGWGGNVNSFYNHIGGNTSNLPTTADAFQRNTDGSDFYLMILSRNAGSLLYATYMGGNGVNEHVDGGTSRFAPDGVVYHAVCACNGPESTFPATPGVFSNTNNSQNCNLAVFKFDLEVFDADFDALDNRGAELTEGCAPLVVQLDNVSDGGESFLWDFGDGTSTNRREPVSHTYSEPGDYIITLEVGNEELCENVSRVQKTITVFPSEFTIPENVSICQGESIQLEASGGSIYEWSPPLGLNRDNIANPIASPEETTNYTVRIENQFGCEFEGNVLVEVFPGIEADFELEVEEGCTLFPEVRLTNASIGDGEFTYDMGNGDVIEAEQGEIVYRYEQEGEFEITLNADNGRCTATEIERVVISRNEEALFYENVTVEEYIPVCVGENAQLNVTGGSRYQWTPVEGLSNPNSRNPVATVDESQEYNVRIFNEDDCFVDSTVVVEVFPNVEASFEVEITDTCEPLPRVEIINNSTGLEEYTFRIDGQEPIVSDQERFDIDLQAGRHQIELIVDNGNCLDEFSQEVLIEFDETALFYEEVEVTEYQVLCLGDQASLNVSGGASYLWSPARGLDRADVANPVTNVVEDTEYNVRIFNEKGCFVDSIVIVDVYPNVEANFEVEIVEKCEVLPEIRIENNSDGLQRYTFDMGDGNVVTVPSEEEFFTYQYDQAGQYDIKLNVGNEFCESEIVKRAEILYDETALFYENITLSEDPILCSGKSVELNVEGGDTYVWTPSVGLNRVDIANPVASPLQTTEYSVRIFNEKGCFVDSTITVNVVPNIKPNLSVEFIEECDTIPSVSFQNLSENYTTAQIDLGNGEIVEINEEPLEVNYEVSGRYDIRLILEGEFCREVYETEIDVPFDSTALFYENVQVSDNQVICDGDGTEIFARGGISYLWSPSTGLSNENIANPIANPEQTTEYNVRIFNEKGCFVDSTVIVQVAAEVALDISYDIPFACGEIPEISIQNNSTGAEIYTWNFGNGDILNGDITSYQYSQKGTYSFLLRGENEACYDELEIEFDIPYVFPPSAFIPNGDGYNDFFIIGNTRPGWKLKVYSRWGEEVYSSEDYKNDWDGDGNLGQYYYQLTSPNGEVNCKGSILILDGN